MFFILNTKQTQQSPLRDPRARPLKGCAVSAQLHAHHTSAQAAAQARTCGARRTSVAATGAPRCGTSAIILSCWARNTSVPAPERGRGRMTRFTEKIQRYALDFRTERVGRALCARPISRVKVATRSSRLRERRGGTPGRVEKARPKGAPLARKLIRIELISN